jgi:nitrogen fixation/metabolism regulation signal transduction histidine kinase
VRADRWRGGLLVRAWQPVADGATTVLVGDLLPADVLAPVLDAIGSEEEYQQLKSQRGTLTATTILVFLAVTLLLLFATVWIGLYLSRRFTQPLLAVAAATQRVAEGDEPEEVAIPASDEVAVLVHSFNAMVRRVRATEEEILASNQELATLLATIPTGVLSVDLESRRFRPNPAAATMLGEASWMGRWIALDELDRRGLSALAERLRPPQLREGRSELELEVAAATRYVEVTTSPLSDGGWVAAIDDLSQLVRAQRQAAWSEVAQRIAHEIKNPLTPIRLAAERLQRRAAGASPELQRVIDSSCAAIVAQVDGLRQLLDAFRQYARMPQVEPRPTPVDHIVREVASLYDGLRDGLEVAVEISDGDLTGVVDPAPLRQALVNLVDNAVDAIADDGRIVLRVQRRSDDIVIHVEDSGQGLPTDDPEMLLQPFFSTKGRGSGMGLALVHRVISEHGGSLRLEDVSPHGARVTVVLPAAPEAVSLDENMAGDASR